MPALDQKSSWRALPFLMLFVTALLLSVRAILILCMCVEIQRFIICKNIPLLSLVTPQMRNRTGGANKVGEKIGSHHAFLFGENIIHFKKMGGAKPGFRT